MEHTKQRFVALALGLALGGTVLLTGCSGGNAPVQPESAGSQAAPAQEDPIPEPDQAQSAAPEEGGLRLLDGAGEAGRYQVRRSETDGTALFTYIDYTTGSEVPLCSQPNCTHDSDACPAWLPAQTASAEVYLLDDGSLLACLFIESTGSLYHMESNGSGRALLAQETAGTDGATPNWGIPLTDGESVYFLRAAMGDGGMRAFLQRMPAGGGALETLWQAAGWNRLLGVNGRGLVLKVEDYAQLDAIPAPEIPEGTSAEEAARILGEYDAQVQAAEYTSRVYLKSVDTGEEQEIQLTGLSMTGADERSLTWQDGALYWTGSNEFGSLYCLRAGADGTFAQTEAELAWPFTVPEGGGVQLTFEPACPALNGTLLVQVQLIDAELNSEMRRCAIDPAAETVWEIPLYYVDDTGLTPVKILAQTGDALLVQYELNSEDRMAFQEDGTVRAASWHTGRYGLISAEDFLAGAPNYHSLTGTMAGGVY